MQTQWGMVTSVKASTVVTRMNMHIIHTLTENNVKTRYGDLFQNLDVQAPNPHDLRSEVAGAHSTSD